MTSAAWHALADPWSEAITRRALAEVALLGLAGGALGCWVVLYELAYTAESLAHALFPGLVGAALLGLPLLLGGGAGILAAAIAVALAGRAPEIGRDAAVGVVVTTLLGLGALLALSADAPPGLAGLLFGDVLATSDADLVLALALLAGTAIVLRLLHGRLLAVGFDRAAARALGVRAGVADVALLALLALAILVAVRGLGNLLVVALLVGPAATARLLVRRMWPMMALAAAIAVGCGTAGLYLSYHAGTAAGASIAGAIVVAFLVAELAAGRPRRVGAGAPTAPDAPHLLGAPGR